MHYIHDKKLAKEYAAAALERIIGEGLTATPDTFELWYAYYSGAHADITRSIDLLVAHHKILTDDHCHDLYNRFLSDARSEETVRRAGDQINTTLKTVSEMVKDVKSATNDFSSKLSDVSVRVQTVRDAGALKAIVTDMVQDTQSMINRNQMLETELEKSALVMRELQNDLENVRREAMTDGLTGLSNRKAFDAALRRVADETAAAGTTFSLLMVDIDYFKNFNDNFGHQIGDQVLRLVARTLTDGVKGRDIATRYGGEEFAIILPETPLDAGVVVGNALRKAVATKDVINRNTAEKLGRITMSAGVAEYKHGENLADLIGRADSALYTAKHNGRNQVAAAPTPGKG